MAEEPEDPREVPWHPRHAPQIVGHDAARQHFLGRFATGKPHHAWLFTGPMGIGKATLAYHLASEVLASGSTNPPSARRWLASRAHPDFAVLERSFNDSKPKRLRAEISVDDVRNFSSFFERTASAGEWKVGLVDCADELNTESANALLKLVEEPPAKSLLLLICHQPGRTLRTLRSRCLKVPLSPLSADGTTQILQHLPLDPAPSNEALDRACRLSNGSPGLALQLLGSTGAKAFDQFVAARSRNAQLNTAISNLFSSRAAAVQDFDIFMSLLLEWVASQAKQTGSLALANAHDLLAQKSRMVVGYNLDRRVAVLEALTMLGDALNAALKAA